MRHIDGYFFKGEDVWLVGDTQWKYNISRELVGMSLVVHRRDTLRERVYEGTSDEKNPKISLSSWIRRLEEC